MGLELKKKKKEKGAEVTQAEHWPGMCTYVPPKQSVRDEYKVEMF